MPLQTSAAGASGDWYWLLAAADDEEGETYVGVQYICSLYWALSVMTGIKGLPAHEDRRCFEVSPLNPNPVGERLLTIGVFLLGAFVYAAFYGNIGQWIQTLDSERARYRSRMDEVNECAPRVHTMPHLG